MSAERLRKVAAEMRDKAEAATSGPWGRASTDDMGFAVHRGEHDTIALYANRNDATHIAAWHPAVALAVADWLDSCADACAYDPPTSPGPTLALAVCDAWEGKP